ncbi:hypothetical protein WME90_35270 [Sorangium sp. So ce375]|uniref:hypothetical protein n=1 Tax=Sorangium sp. So ce375 TaxID=3133306 RepID=UPI003F5C250F
MYTLSAGTFDVPWRAGGRGARGSSSGSEDVVSLLCDGRLTIDRSAWELTTNDPQLALNIELRAAARASVVDEPIAAAGGSEDSSEDSGELDAALSVSVCVVSETIIYPRASAFDLQRGADMDIAFGGGDHYCIGATLARLEGRLAIDTLLGRSPRRGSRGRPSWHGRPRS